MVIRHVDCSITEGQRGQKEQHEAFINGFSKVDWPNGKHNDYPSDAIDAAPHPWNYKKPDLNRLRVFAGFVLGVGAAQGIILRWGGDWDRDFDLSDEKWRDMYHFEFVRSS